MAQAFARRLPHTDRREGELPADGEDRQRAASRWPLPSLPPAYSAADRTIRATAHAWDALPRC